MNKQATYGAKPAASHRSSARVERATGADSVVHAQRMFGNRALHRFLQAKLTVSQPDDLYEQEADRVADEVMRMPEPAATVGTSGPPRRIQRLCSGCEEELQRDAALEEDEPLMRTAGDAADLDERAGEIEPYISGLSGKGQPLPESTRDYMEPRFGADFSNVRVHTDSAAAEGARAVDALAFTVGRDIVFRAGRYDPDSEPGRRLLAHELTHVVQQGAAGAASVQRQGEAAAPAAAPAAAEPTDAAIEALDLADTAEKAAYALKKKRPAISFTSGRRSVADQASAMAANIVSGGRKWIEETYSDTSARRKLQKWVDDHAEATTVEAIAAGLEETFNSLTDTQKGYVTKHITGEAFDVQPQTEDADAIKSDIRALTGITKFLEMEGGLVRWHAQFKRAAETSPHEREADSVALHGVSAPAGEDGVRDHVGNLLGFDFSAVRVHRDAAEAQAQGAHALAAGADIYLAPGRYRPDLPAGRALLAHELAHVAQQGAAPRLTVGPGVFRAALERFGGDYSSERLAERAATLADPQPALTPAPRGMQQRCVAGCARCSSPESSGDAGKQAQPTAPATGSVPSPTHAVGPDVATAGHRVVRLSWTVDDGPTPFTPAMSTALSPRAATWFIMNNQLGTGAARTTAMSDLATRQRAGDEIGIHSMHPTVGHSAWFPIHLGTAVPQGYTATADAMTDLTAFTGELRTGGLNVHFARMPGGELSEVKKYVEDQGGAPASSQAVARALLAGTAPPVAAPAAVATDVALVMSTLRTLNLHLWSGSATGPEVTGNTWEAESSGVPARTNDVLRRFTGVVDALASGTRTTPGSFVILAHDTTQADVTEAGANIGAMETYATTKGVRVEYYRMADLYQILRSSPP